MMRLVIMLLLAICALHSIALLIICWVLLRINKREVLVDHYHRVDPGSEITDEAEHWGIPDESN